MKKKYSLKGVQLFREVFTQGERFSKNGLRLFVLKIPMNGSIALENGAAEPAATRTCRIGLSIQKSYGNAVHRNRIKRRIRAISGTVIANIKNDILIIIQATGSVRSMRFDLLEKTMLELFNRSGILIK